MTSDVFVEIMTVNVNFNQFLLLVYADMLIIKIAQGCRGGNQAKSSFQGVYYMNQS